MLLDKSQHWDCSRKFEELGSIANRGDMKIGQIFEHFAHTDTLYFVLAFFEIGCDIEKLVYKHFQSQQLHYLKGMQVVEAEDMRWDEILDGYLSSETTFAVHQENGKNFHILVGSCAWDCF